MNRRLMKMQTMSKQFVAFFFRVVVVVVVVVLLLLLLAN